MATPRVLLVDDERAVVGLLALALKDAGYHADVEHTGTAAVARLSDEVYDAVITDLRLEDMTGIDILRIACKRYPSPAVLIMTGYGSVDSAVEAMKLGAADYLTKPVYPQELLLTLDRALQHRQLLSELDALRQRVGQLQLDDLIGISPSMQTVFRTIQRIARTDVTVLITGESGTGKELVARAIHNHSSRAAHPFLTVNCSALTETLLESELFGHAKGAFTGAIVAKKGLFEDADGGTLLLDEIGDMELGAQAALLRVLESGEVRRVGETRPVGVDVRIVASTNRDLENAIREGKFREDLYYRLRVVPVDIPPLRKRLDDVLPLAQHFLARYAPRFNRGNVRLAKETGEALLRYTWPGNVRELEHAIERALLLSDGDVLLPEDLPPEVSSPPASRANTMQLTLADMERQHILERLDQCSGNRSEAARQLGISRNTLARKLKSYGFSDEETNEASDEAFP
ncbi:MAG TPA: sigma-54 dependent transcriptional regulator [Candidatus Latescibacteria bacterium]|mgnify:FL=1|nr:sigma-54 dependent transcriptional regulator [Candidatus Latescibacterota bacterium]